MLSIKTYNIEKCRQLTKSTLIPSFSLAMRRNSRNKNITYQCCLMKTKTLPHVQRKLPISSNVNSIACSVIHQRQWNCIPADTRAIQSMDTFKSKITQVMLSVPDTPPIRGYTPINSNSILEWRNNRDASALWGGRRI